MSQGDFYTLEGNYYFDVRAAPTIIDSNTHIRPEQRITLTYDQMEKLTAIWGEVKYSFHKESIVEQGEDINE